MKKYQLLAVAICIFAVQKVHAQLSSYNITNVFPVSGEGKWDYLALNPVNQDLYISHGTQVNIINKLTGAATGIIPHTDGVHGIAFSEKYKKGFTSNGKKNSVTVFDIYTNKFKGDIPTGKNPDAIMYDAFSDKVYVCNGSSNNITIIDPADDKVVATIPVGGRPETAVSDDHGCLYVNVEDKNEVIVINTKTYKVEQHWGLGVGEEPSGLAIDVENKRLFSGCGNGHLVILALPKGNIIKDLSIGEGCDGVVFDTKLRYIFCANGSGTVSVIKELTGDSYKTFQPILTQKGARTLALDSKTHTVYIPTSTIEPTLAKAAKLTGLASASFNVITLSSTEK